MAVIETQYLEWIHKEIDGENSPKESAALLEYMSANPAARKLFDELQQLSCAFNQMEETDPPEDIGKSVLSEIRARKHERTARMLHPERAALKINVLKYAYVFAAGFILAALLAPLAFKLMQGSGSPDFSQLLGTLSRKDVFRGPAVSQGIEAAGVAGKIQLRRAGTLLLIEVEITSQQPVEVVLQYDANRLRFNGLEQWGKEALYFQSSPEQLSWTHRGQQHYRILMTDSNRGTPAIRMKVLSSGNSLYDSSFPLPTSP